MISCDDEIVERQVHGELAEDGCRVRNGNPVAEDDPDRGIGHLMADHTASARRASRSGHVKRIERARSPRQRTAPECGSGLMAEVVTGTKELEVGTT